VSGTPVTGRHPAALTGPLQAAPTGPCLMTFLTTHLLRASIPTKTTGMA
jgi:hypothetical protein